VLVTLVLSLWFGERRTDNVPLPNPASQPAGGSASSSVPSASAVSPDALPASENDEPGSNAGLPFRAKAAAAMDLTNGEMLYEFQSDLRWPVASLTKVMTAFAVAEHMDQASTIILAGNDFAVGGSSLTTNLQPGDEYRVADLLKILLVPSSNEAAEALARDYGKSRFMATMNSQAAFWGLGSTYFHDPSGLSAANQSTPREFLELVRRAYASHPEVFTITRSPGVAAQDLRTGAFKYFYSTNNLAGRPDFLGGKTGTTPTAGENLVSVFLVQGRPVGVLVFGADDRYAATASLLQLIQ
jgi:D-alanyl-D-alanine carboxypeptidase